MAADVQNSFRLKMDKRQFIWIRFFRTSSNEIGDHDSQASTLSLLLVVREAVDIKL